MSQLSTDILNEKWISGIEGLLIDAMQDVELIGELHIDEPAFRYITDQIRREWKFDNKIQKNRFKPATFVTSLVFSARYSGDKTRVFWGDYAKDVWKLDRTQSFYKTCIDYYYIAQEAINKQSGLALLEVIDGRIVRLIYQHAIIPAYLHDDFAEWLIKYLDQIRKYPAQRLSDFIREESVTRYIPPTLRRFMTNNDTHDLAVELVDELLQAIDLLAEHDPDDVRDIFSNMIQQELWDKLLDELEKVQQASPPTSYKRKVKLEWVWSFADEDWVLRLMNLTTDHNEEPNYCVWSPSDDAQTAIQNNYLGRDIYPEFQANSQWRVRELVLGTMQIDNELGFVYVYDRHGNVIYNQRVPSIRKADAQSTQFYRITQQQQYAIPVDTSKVTSGQWLVSYQDELMLKDKSTQVIEPDDKQFYVSGVMRHYMEHNHIDQYTLELPFEINDGKTTQRIERSKSKLLKPPVLSTDHQLPDTSKRLPPVYTSNKVTLYFPDVVMPVGKLKIHLTAASGHNRYEAFVRYATKHDAGYEVDISRLIPNDQIGNYELDVTYGFKSRLPSPIEFSVVPNVQFSTMPQRIFNALDLPTIRVDNLNSLENVEIASRNTNASIESTTSNQITVTWNDLRAPSCRLELKQGDHIVPIEWDIDRVYAWLEKTSQSDRMLRDELNKAIIEFRGKPKEELQLYVGENSYIVYLNAKGQSTFEMQNDQFRDILNNETTSEVPVTLAFDDQQWLFFTFVSKPQITKLEVEFIHESLLIDAKLSRGQEANYEFLIIDANSNKVCAKHRVVSLDDLILIKCELEPGEYTIALKANSEPLDLPKDSRDFVIRMPHAEIIAQLDTLTSTADITYVIDYILAGTYTIVVLNENNHVLASDILNIEGTGITLSGIDVNQAAYYVEVRWKDQTIGRATLEQSEVESAENPSDHPVVLSDDNNWVEKLILSPPNTIDSRQLFSLATIDPSMLKSYAIPKLRQLWRSLARLAEVNQPQHWRSTYGLLPTWCLLENAIIMITPKGGMFSVYPEKILLNGREGIGSIRLETPQEGEVFAYTRWSMRSASESRWQIWMPEEDPPYNIFSKLDELDMRPIYYDRLSGQFHGKRDDYLSPGYDALKHTFLVDCVHDYTLLGHINHTSTPLKQVYDPDISIDRRYLLSILTRKDDLENKTVDKTKPTTAGGYRYAISQTLAQDERHKSNIKKLATSKKLNQLVPQIAKLRLSSRHSLISGAHRFFKGMQQQIPTSENHKGLQLDINILALAIILRSFSLGQQSIRTALMNSIDISEEELIDLLTKANESCPHLLEWAMTWAEIFIVHSSTS